jgi:DNA-binding response OmpR family regulator/two-component sensor histidine kinase
MRRSGKNLLDLINQLLDISKLESGSMMLRASCQNVASLLKRIVEAFISAAERKQITLAFEAAESEIVAYVDQDKLEKIVNNLLANAIKFTPEGGGIQVAVCVANEWETRRVGDGGKGREGERESGRVDSIAPSHPLALSPAHSQKGRFVQITIKDTGIGIPTDKIDKIFDRFYQVDTSQTRSYGGTGIGLALAKELVDLHHGEISVASEKGMGTTFIVRLPLGKAHLAPEEIVEAPSVESIPEEPSAEWEEIIAPATGAEAQRPRRVKSAPILLVVEDNADMRAYLCSLLSPVYRVIESVDGQDGLEKALRIIPDLIISDVMMPKMDGFALCGKLKTDERTSHIPVILLTARASAESRIAGLETGADDYIAKPFEARELQVRVKNLIEQRRKLRERFRKETAFQPHVMAVTSTDERFLQKAMTVVEARMSDEDFSVEIFGREVGMSRVQLHRKLRALTDHSASEFIRTLRLNRAAQLLAQRGGNVTEVAYQVGFNNLSYFAKCFHQQFGVSPSTYATGSAKELQKAD